MGFLALVVALLIERLRPLRPDNRIRATISRLSRAVRIRLDSGRRRDGVVGWAVVMALSLVAILVAQSIAASLHPVFVFALHVFVLYCTIGFRQFSEAFTEIRVAFAADDAPGARRILTVWVRDSEVDDASVSAAAGDVPAETCRTAIAHALLVAHRQVLGPLFCYIVIPGAAGPLLYRVAETLARHWRRDDVESMPASTATVMEADDREEGDQWDSTEVGDADSWSADEGSEPVDVETRAFPASGPAAASRDAQAASLDEHAASMEAQAASIEAQAVSMDAPDASASTASVDPDAHAPVSRWGAFAVRAFEAIDWLPVRLSAGGFAVAGNFEDALYCWRAVVSAGLRDARTLLLAAGGGALGLRLVDTGAAFDAPGGEARPASLQVAANLVWRSLLMWIGLYALITVSAWMGS